MDFNYFLAAVMRNFGFLQNDYDFRAEGEEVLGYLYIVKFKKRNFEIRVRYSMRNKFLEVILFKNTHKEEPTTQSKHNAESLLELSLVKGVTKEKDMVMYVTNKEEVELLLQKFASFLKALPNILKKADGW